MSEQPVSATDNPNTASNLMAAIQRNLAKTVDIATSMQLEPQTPFNWANYRENHHLQGRCADIARDWPSKPWFARPRSHPYHRAHADAGRRKSRKRYPERARRVRGVLAVRRAHVPLGGRGADALEEPAAG